MISVFQGRVADRNPRAMRAAAALGQALADRFDLSITHVGEPQELLEGGWARQLRASTPTLEGLAAHLAARLESGGPSILIAGRCAASIATLPVVAKHWPDVCVVWFDAHGDCNSPSDEGVSENAYLGGMVLSGAAGEWDTGLGNGLPLSQVVLVGSRDLDPPEIEKIRTGKIRLIKPGSDLAAEIISACGARPVYVHLDCDVLNAGLVPTEYQVDGGLGFDDLRHAFSALSRLRVVGFEIAEYEGAWPDGGECDPTPLLDAIAPLAGAMAAVSHRRPLGGR